MIKLNRWLVMGVVASAMSFGADRLAAQDNAAPGNGNNNGGQGGQGRRRGGGFGGGNFDPAQMQQQMIEGYKERLEVSDDSEWKVIEPLVTKVVEARRDSMAGMARGMFRRNRGGGGAGGGGAAGDNGPRPQMFGTPSPEAETLQKAIDSKASKEDLKAALAKFVEARKAKQAELEKAQADLRKVLSLRQEAIATESGLL